MSNNGTLKRDPSMDIVRCVALYLVISVHFFLNSGFYSEPVIGKAMFVMTVMRTAFMSCVPLFLILSGYLTGHKKLCKGYYKGIYKTISTYLLACAANLLWRHYALGFSFTPFQVVTGILDFSAAPYGWYIEMYIGLFLLTPFLNALYHGLGGKRQKLMLLFTLIFLTSLSSVVNIFDFTTAGWWKMPSISAAYTKLIPNWWGGLWPLTYYYIGIYLKEYGLNIKPGLNLLFYLLAVLLFGSFGYYRSYGTNFVGGEWTGWGALPNVVMASLLFHFLMRIVKVRSKRFSRFWARLSSLCLGAYLVSYIFDTAFYPKLIQYVPDVKSRLFYYPLITALVLICSMLLSFMLKLLQQFLGAVCIWASRLCKGIRKSDFERKTDANGEQ